MSYGYQIPRNPDGTVRTMASDMQNNKMQNNKVNYRKEHEILRAEMELAQNRCMEIQDNCSSARNHLTSIGKIEGEKVPGTLIEIGHATVHLQKAEWLLDYVRQELKLVEQCFSMRDENGEIA